MSRICDSLRELSDVTSFEPRPVPVEAVCDALEAVRMSPSAGNVQPWEVAILSDQAVIGRLSECTLDPFMRDDPFLKPSWIGLAPMVAVVCMDVRRARARSGEAGERFATGDIGAAVVCFRIALKESGLSSGVVREFDAAKVRRAIGAPEWVRPEVLVGIGYSGEEAYEAPSLEVQDFAHWGAWDRRLECGARG